MSTENEFKALDAKMILEHPLFSQAFDKVRESYILTIETGDITDDGLRDKLMLGLQNLAAIRAQLEAHIVNAQLQAQPIEEF